jgi:hypothetical protein
MRSVYENYWMHIVAVTKYIGKRTGEALSDIAMYAIKAVSTTVVSKVASIS